MTRGRPPKIVSPWGRISRFTRRDGSIAYRLRGTVEGRVVSLGIHDTVAEAVAQAEAMRLAHTKTTGPLTLGGWVAEWLDDREEAKTHRSLKTMRVVAAAYIEKAPIAAIPLRHVQPEHVRQWLSAIGKRKAKTGRSKGKPLAEQTLRNALHLLGAAFRDAIEAGKARTNPCTGVRVPRRATSDDTWTYLSIDEIHKTLACTVLDDPRAVNKGLRSAITLAIFGGLRAGELWGLHWHDVHMDAADPYVMVRYSYAGPTKSGKPRRVPLLPPAIVALREWRAIQRREQARAHSRKGVPIPLRGLVWPGVDGSHHADGYDARWPEVREKLGFGRRVRLHDLRHTFASHLISGSWGRAWTLEEVQVVLGHAKRTTTERYAHLAPEARVRAEREARGAWDFGHHSGTAETAKPESS